MAVSPAPPSRPPPHHQLASRRRSLTLLHPLEHRLESPRLRQAAFESELPSSVRGFDRACPLEERQRHLRVREMEGWCRSAGGGLVLS